MTYHYTPLFPLAKDQTRYRKLTGEGVRAETLGGREFLSCRARRSGFWPKRLSIDINHLLRPGHLAQLAQDPRRSGGDATTASSPTIF